MDKIIECYNRAMDWVLNSDIRLKDGGYLILEIGYGQTAAIKSLIESAGSYRDVKIIKDYNDIDRVVFAKRH